LEIHDIHKNYILASKFGFEGSK